MRAVRDLVRGQVRGCVGRDIANGAQLDVRDAERGRAVCFVPQAAGVATWCVDGNRDW